jgi:uncharacterized protein YkwD
VLRKKHILAVSAAALLALSAVSVAGAGVRKAHRSHSSTVAGLLQAVNHTRAAHGLRPLVIDPALARAARSHSVEMMRGNYFAHGDFAGRMSAFHVRGPAEGENLAWGNGSYSEAPSIVAMWLASPGHRANLLHAGWTRIGIGIVTGTFMGNGGSAVVTADFAGT